ncbi:MAG: radical SAM family heme chaperone HemW [Gemmatimonadales bacterium]|jgi:oxygen-independent coproporphyrinogen-3 oxidase
MHLYVHVPFCARRCVYCDFAIAVRRSIPVSRYVQAVSREWQVRGEREGWHGEAVTTLYFGGGTPSLLPTDAIAELTELLSARGAEDDVELTLEANPDDVTPKAATAWREAGVNRVSLGAQSFDRRPLAWMHRTHGVGAAERAVARLRQAGVADVSLDLIFGFPDEVGHDFERDLDRALALEPDHLSVYGLTVEPATALGKWVERGRIRPVNDERYTREFLLAHERLTAAGYEHYEVSNYARPGRRARHNAAYWERRPYIGLGPSAHSLRDHERRWNERHWAAYETRVRDRGDPVAGRERLDDEQRRLEAVYLGLRTSEGIAASLLDGAVEPNLERAGACGWLVAEGGRVRATADGWLRLDALVAGLTTSP